MSSAEGNRAEDVIQPFLIDRTQLRGRLVRLGAVLDSVLTRQSYPRQAAQLLGETVVLAVTLASALKFDGIFTLQASGDGPISILMSDVAVGQEGQRPGQRDVRGYARVDWDRLATANGDQTHSPLRALIGQGLLAFTVDQGAYTDRYQGIVELAGDTLTECVQAYFRQSEQLDSGIRLAVGQDRTGRWRGGAIMIQRLPEASRPASNVEVDDWRHTMLLLGTCTDGELLSSDLDGNDLLYRLFHEDGVRVFDPASVGAGCRCSLERVRQVLRSIPRAELADVETPNGDVELTCDFCNTVYRFGREEVDAIHATSGEPAGA